MKNVLPSISIFVYIRNRANIITVSSSMFNGIYANENCGKSTLP